VGLHPARKATALCAGVGSKLRMDPVWDAGPRTRLVCREGMRRLRGSFEGRLPPACATSQTSGEPHRAHGSESCGALIRETRSGRLESHFGTLVRSAAVARPCKQFPAVPMRGLRVMRERVLGSEAGQGARTRSLRFPIGRSRTILERSLERMLSPRAYVPGSCLEIRSVRVQAVIGSVPSSKHSRMELKQRMGNRMERSGMGLETPSWAARSRVTLEAGLENRMERFLRSRDGGRADERSKRFRETATRICAPPVRTSPRRPPRQCPGRRPRTPTASPQGKIRPPVPRPRTGGSALIPASSPGSASAPRPSTRGAPPSHRRSTSS